MTLEKCAWTTKITEATVPVRLVGGIKTLFVLLMALAAFAVLYSGLSAPIAPHRDYFRLDIVFVSVVSLLHLAYLWIIFDQYILGKGVDDVCVAELVFPGLLVLVYILYGAHSVAWNTGEVSISRVLKHLAYLAFIALYIGWLIYDWRTSKWRRAAEVRAWVVIDGLAAVFLTLYLVGAINEFPLLGQVVQIKDATVIVCITVWAGLRQNSLLKRREYYRLQYLDYLRHNTPQPPPSITLSPITAGDAKATRIIDFGCGDGTRLVDAITWLRTCNALPADTKIEVIGFDRDESWGVDYKKTCAKNNLPCKFIGDQESALRKELATANLVVLSHVLYEVGTWAAVQNLLAECPHGTRVLARGIAARSFFTIINLAFSRRFPSPTISHLWLSHGLQGMVNKGLLSEIDRVCIAQPYTLDESGAAAAENLLGSLYGEGAAGLAREYFHMLQGENCQEVPNDDIFVLLEVTKPA